MEIRHQHSTSSTWTNTIIIIRPRSIDTLEDIPTQYSYCHTCIVSPIVQVFPHMSVILYRREIYRRNVTVRTSNGRHRSCHVSLCSYHDNWQTTHLTRRRTCRVSPMISKSIAHGIPVSFCTGSFQGVSF